MQAPLRLVIAYDGSASAATRLCARRRACSPPRGHASRPWRRTPGCTSGRRCRWSPTCRPLRSAGTRGARRRGSSGGGRDGPAGGRRGAGARPAGRDGAPGPVHAALGLPELYVIETGGDVYAERQQWDSGNNLVARRSHRTDGALGRADDHEVLALRAAPGRRRACGRGFRPARSLAEGKPTDRRRTA
jgi:hypothetical protein